jgi:hypothetical protein
MNTEKHVHETKDVDVPSMFLIALILFLSGTLVCLAMWGLLRFLVTKQYAEEAVRAPAAKAGALFPQPRVQAQPAVDLQKLRAAEDARLSSYGWIDRPAGVMRIPIDRAMQLLLERGLPEVGGNQTPLQYMQSRPQEIPSPRPLPR